MVVLLIIVAVDGGGKGKDRSRTSLYGGDPRHQKQDEQNNWFFHATSQSAFRVHISTITILLEDLKRDCSILHIV
jgi:hypothetical protein